MEQPTIGIKLLYEDSKLPAYQHPLEDSGMDVCAYSYSYPGNPGKILDIPENGIVINPRSRMLIRVGFSLELPEGYEAQIRSRSGLALKNGVCVLNSPGTIDRGYRDEVGVILYNSSDDWFSIKKGDRIAQMVIAPVAYAHINSIMTLSLTARNGGFGSTGV